MDTIVDSARSRGRQAAKDAASWIIDGNLPHEHYVTLARKMRDGDDVDEFLPAYPNLSGEWADDATEHSLARELLPADQATNEAAVAYLVGAWEEGVREVFSAECERLVNAQLHAAERLQIHLGYGEVREEAAGHVLVLDDHYSEQLYYELTDRWQ